jgi:hypothetical protein
MGFISLKQKIIKTVCKFFESRTEKLFESFKSGIEEMQKVGGGHTKC